jgi:polysaccharide deacetylase family protein (PEP-CTERM system associated)
MSAIVNVMTVDVEEYFHASAFDRVVSRSSWADRESRVVRCTEVLLECFDRANLRATFFVLGWVAERYPQLVRDIATSGHEIASHGFHHQLIYMLTPEQFREDVKRAKATIEDAAGCEVRGYRAPSFSIVGSALWALDVLIDEGYRYDASIFPIHHDRYGIADAPRHAHVIERQGGTIVEIPASTVRVGGRNLPIAGGGYFRLLPYEWTRSGLARVNREGEPVIFYVHPWEIDPEQPLIDIGRVATWRHRVGLARTLARLEQLCSDFTFGTIQSMLASQSRADVPAMARCAYAK